MVNSTINNKKNFVKVSKFLSYILRHNPQKYGLELDANGFTNLKEVLKLLKKRFPNIDIDKSYLENLIRQSDKKRFQITDGKIRAYYGHSIDKKIKFSDTSNIPDKLYHGTTHKAFKKIKSQGLKSKGRQYVHLSKDVSTAKEVGKRRTPSPIILEIDAKNARNKGINFYKSGDMILSDFIPSEYISKLE
jgi:putative RNA 2'-phosphotransferase